MELPQLSRRLRPGAKAPVRIVHLGLGAFHRSHQAWYTHQASDAADWGIAAFTGRRPDAALALAEQDGLYTIVNRADGGDSFAVVSSIVEAVDGADVQRLAELVAAPATAVITLTITEAAYRLRADGQLDRAAPDVAADLALLASGSGSPATPLGRLVLALAARRAAGAGPLAVVCCDNLSNNGTVAHNAVAGMAGAWDAGLAGWIDANVSFVSTSVDRITPRTTAADIAAVQAACGYRDNSPVVAEPFSNWVLSGDFPAGRPRWEDAGAVFVAEIEPYENRKLWLLNGAHSLLAYAGQLRGHTTVAQALADPLCLQAVEKFWDEAEANLSGPEGNAADLQIPAYRAALLAAIRQRPDCPPPRTDRDGRQHQAADARRSGAAGRACRGQVRRGRRAHDCRLDGLQRRLRRVPGPAGRRGGRSQPAGGRRADPRLAGPGGSGPGRRRVPLWT